MLNHEQARTLLLSFPGETEAPCYGAPSFRVRKKFRNAWVVVAAAALATGACRSEAPGAQGDAEGVDSTATPVVASSGPKACDVISTADLSRITGLQLEEGTLTNDYGGVSQCRWRRAGGTDNGVTVSVREQGEMSIYASVSGAAAVQGIGDEAVWNPTTHQLAFRVGPRIASMTFLFDEGREQWAREIAAIIQKALATAPASP